MIKRSETLWQALATVSVICLVLITGIFVRREFFAPHGDPGGMPPLSSAAIEAGAIERPVPVTDWERVASRGHRLGSADAPVTLVVFTDYECPACQRFERETVGALRERFGDRLAMVYRNWPIRRHELAYGAARAAECAAQQNRFEAFHTLLVRQHDSIGAKPYPRFAREAGVADLNAFARCAADTTPVPSIAEDVAEVRRIGGKGTPTIVINGIRMRPPYSAEALGAFIDSLLGQPSAAHAPSDRASAVRAGIHP